MFPDLAADALLLVAAFMLGLVPTFLFVATGGVGLITTPGLIHLGLSPQTAIATDLFAMLGGRLGGLAGFRKAGAIDMQLALRLSVVCAVGSVIGAQLLLALDEQLIRHGLSVVLLLLLVFLFLKPDAGLVTGEAGPLRRAMGYLLMFIVGIWGTLIGAGVISLGSAVLLFIFRKRFIETAALLTLVGLAIGLVGMVMFGSYGVIDWPLGLALLAGKSVGGYFGSLRAIRVGDKWIRWLFAVVVLLSAISLNLT
ncbi:MAG: sulfite exporter TauE/SafE family protein [Pseudomonadales bacterium]|nr:sulfite exporter TauE/SafE family protein [Pseudomonadales bacterium]